MKYQTMFDYFDATDFELKLTQSLQLTASEVQPSQTKPLTQATSENATNVSTEESKDGSVIPIEEEQKNQTN